MAWKFFKLSEFACKHCGQNMMNPDSSTSWMRCAKSGSRFDVTSGYRCPLQPEGVQHRAKRPAHNRQGGRPCRGQSGR